MSAKIRNLQARKAESVKAARALTDKATAESRDFSAEEQTQYDAHATGIKNANAAIEREQLLAAEEAQLGVAVADDAKLSVKENREADPKRGFATLGAFSQAVIRAGRANGNVDERLLIGAAAPTTFGSEGVGQDGGFAVPPTYAAEIYTLSMQEDSFLPLTDSQEIGSNSMVYPKDETVPWGTDGVRAYWQNEAAAATATKPKLGLVTQRLNKLMALVPLSDELIDDQTALQSYLPSKVADSIRWKTNEALCFGLGNGQPIGAFNGGAVITQTKESGQSTLTFNPLNFFKMIARLPPGSFSRAIWMMNNDSLPALFGLTLGNYPIYLPPSSQVGAIQGSPYGTLLGRPIIISQHAPSFSSLGDVTLADWKYYRTLTKAGGIQTATSMHLYFDADATAFRATFRVDGAPKIVAPITPAKGSNTLSPFVQLEAR